MSCSPQNPSPTSPLSPSWPMFSAPSSPMPTSSTSSDSSPIRSVAQLAWLFVAFAVSVEFPRFPPLHFPFPWHPARTLPRQLSAVSKRGVPNPAAPGEPLGTPRAPAGARSPRELCSVSLLGSAQRSAALALLCSAAGKKCTARSKEPLESSATLVFWPQPRLGSQKGDGHGVAQAALCPG